MRLIEDILATEDPSYRMPPKPHVTSRFMVTSDMVGPAIIGKQGTHAKHVRERTGVKIEVERKFRGGGSYLLAFGCHLTNLWL